jgi:hypothetical protein
LLSATSARLRLVVSEAEVADTQFRGALDEFQARNSQEFASLAAGDEASPVQLEYSHFTRRLLDRLAQSRQETAEGFADAFSRALPGSHAPVPTQAVS